MRKMAELTKLEAALKSSLNEVERRERRLALAEEEAAGKRRQEASMLEQRRAELQETRKRMREEAAHDVSMAEARRNEALQQLQDEKARMKESEERNAWPNSRKKRTELSVRFLLQSTDYQENTPYAGKPKLQFGFCRTCL